MNLNLRKCNDKIQNLLLKVTYKAVKRLLFTRNGPNLVPKNCVVREILTVHFKFFSRLVSMITTKQGIGGTRSFGNAFGTRSSN